MACVKTEAGCGGELCYCFIKLMFTPAARLTPECMKTDHRNPVTVLNTGKIAFCVVRYHRLPPFSE